MKIFFDLEFTGLHKKTTPISIGLITEDGHKFYAEFFDYDTSQCDDWIWENVISKLRFKDLPYLMEDNKEEKTLFAKSYKSYIAQVLHEWLSQFKDVEFWGDSVSYDWVMLMDLLGLGEPMRKKPKNFKFYQAFDVFTVLRMKNEKWAKINRHELLGIEKGENQHNALYDAEITLQIYNKYVK